MRDEIAFHFTNFGYSSFAERIHFPVADAMCDALTHLAE